MDYKIKYAAEIDVLNPSLENPNLPALNRMLNKGIETGITVLAALETMVKMLRQQHLLTILTL